MKLLLTDSELKTLLLNERMISENDWASAERNAARRRRSIAEILIERGFFSEQYLYELIASKLKMSYVNLRAVKIDGLFINALPEEVARRTRCIAFGKDDRKRRVKVACINPLDEESRQLVEKTLQMPVEYYLMNEKSFRFSSRLYNTEVKEQLLNLINEHIQKAKRKVAEMDLPVVKIFDILLEYALLEQASDIHIEPLPDAVLVRFRIDGQLHDKIELPLTVRDALIARIKILSNLKIDEHRTPQDGRFSFKIDDTDESARVSIIPTMYGEKAVMRLLSEEMQSLSLQDIGLSRKNLDTVLKQAKKPFGMILVVGPTGSGKTTTLYAVLNILNTENVNISTIEDPIEYGIRRINQTQVNVTAGYTFANGLRSLLRQDPDIIMIGEIRDGETAQIAVRAALTGHLVLSTLHTNNASGTPPRLLDMGVEPFLVSSTLNIIIAQRLVRRICRQCIASYKLTSGEVRALSKEFDLQAILRRMVRLGIVDPRITKFSSLSFYKGKGCRHCHGTGYTGRVGVFELLENTQAMQQGIIKRLSSEDLEVIAVQEGMVSIFEDAMERAFLGITTLEEVLRITRE